VAPTPLLRNERGGYHYLGRPRFSSTGDAPGGNSRKRGKGQEKRTRVEKRSSKKKNNNLIMKRKEIKIRRKGPHEAEENRGKRNLPGCGGRGQTRRIPKEVRSRQKNAGREKRVAKKGKTKFEIATRGGEQQTP